MAALQCEICGGKLVGKPGGLFECEYCGMEYNTDWAKAKIQEIKGTVKVEGTVEVTGTVQVKGVATAVTLTEKGFLDQADGIDWRARDCFTRALEADPNYGDAHLGLAMVHKKCYTRKDFWKALMDGEFLPSDELQRALNCKGSETLAKEIMAYNVFCNQLEQQKLVHKEAGKAHSAEYAELRKAYAPAMDMITRYGMTALKSDGTSVMMDSCLDDQNHDWKDMVALASAQVDRRSLLTGLRADGSVWILDKLRVNGKEEWHPYCVIENEEHIQQIALGSARDLTCGWSCLILGLRKNGTVAVRQKGLSSDLYRISKVIPNWSNIRQIAAEGQKIYALKTDGSVIYCYSFYEAITEELVPAGDVVAVVPYGHGVMYLHADGTVSSNGALKTSVQLWTDLIQITSHDDCIIGLKADGSVVVDNEGEVKQRAEALRDVIAINGPLAVKKNGTVAVLDPKLGKLKGERLFDDVEELQQFPVRLREKLFREKEEARITLQKKQEALTNQKQALENELSNLRGLFTGKRRKEIEARLSEIETELKGLE